MRQKPIVPVSEKQQRARDMLDLMQHNAKACRLPDFARARLYGELA